jgi:zinc/manganese transport system substrate-binding protein
MSPLVRVVLAIGATLALAAAENAPRLRVVATTTILADIARQVGGDRVAVQALLPARADVHGYEPTPADVAAVGSAQLVIINGLGLEGWLERLVHEAKAGTRVVTASERIEPLVVEGGHDHDEHDHDEHDHGHDHGGSDPHAWLDARNGALYAEHLGEAFAAADPAGAEDYRAWAAIYAAQLRLIDAWIRREIAAIPEPQRALITTHDSLGYFARAYGLRVLPLRGSDPAHEPDAAGLAALIARAREAGVRAAFLEDGAEGDRMVAQVAKEAGIAIGGSLFTDALAPAGEPGDSYVGMLVLNARAVVRGLR